MKGGLELLLAATIVLTGCVVQKSVGYYECMAVAEKQERQQDRYHITFVTKGKMYQAEIYDGANGTKWDVDDVIEPGKEFKIVTDTYRRFLRNGHDYLLPEEMLK